MPHPRRGVSDPDVALHGRASTDKKTKKYKRPFFNNYECITGPVGVVNRKSAAQRPGNLGRRTPGRVMVSKLMAAVARQSSGAFIVGFREYVRRFGKNPCSLGGTTLAQRAGASSPAPAALDQYVGASIVVVCFRYRLRPDYDFATHRRGWGGFHRHATLCIAAYGFLVAARLAAGRSVAAKKTFVARQVPARPEDCIPRGSSSPARAAACVIPFPY